MKRKSLLIQVMIGAMALMLTGFIFGCDGDGGGGTSGGSVTVSSQCTGICRDDVPSSFSAIPTRAQQGKYRYTQHRLPNYRAGGTVYMPTGVDKAGAIVYCPPFTGTQMMLAPWGPFFAANGIILVTIDTTTVADPVDSRDDQQWAAVEALKNDSEVRNILDTSRIGVMGWSMGGGATWINAQTRNPKTAMSLAGHNATAGATSKGRGIQCPTLLFNGATDTTILGGMGQSDGVYDAIPAGIAKIIYVVSGVGHMTWGSPTQAGDDVARIALAFQKTFLENDGRWAKFLTQRPSRVSKWQTNIVVQ